MEHADGLGSRHCVLFPRPGLGCNAELLALCTECPQQSASQRAVAARTHSAAVVQRVQRRGSLRWFPPCLNSLSTYIGGVWPSRCRTQSVWEVAAQREKKGSASLRCSSRLRAIGHRFLVGNKSGISAVWLPHTSSRVDKGVTRCEVTTTSGHHAVDPTLSQVKPTAALQQSPRLDVQLAAVLCCVHWSPEARAQCTHRECGRRMRLC